MKSAEKRSRRNRATPGAAAVLVALLSACAGPKDGQTTTLTVPDGMTFPPVSDALEIHCGTLDCHGSVYRNLRLLGHNGARLDPKDVTGINVTTSDEYQANYISLIAIAPEPLSAIVSSGGKGFDKWIVITKGTNAEHHKGGQRMKNGDDTYNCLKSWVVGTLNMDACMNASMFDAPGGDNF